MSLQATPKANQQALVGGQAVGGPCLCDDVKCPQRTDVTNVMDAANSSMMLETCAMQLTRSARMREQAAGHSRAGHIYAKLALTTCVYMYPLKTLAETKLGSNCKSYRFQCMTGSDAICVAGGDRFQCVNAEHGRHLS